MKTQTFRLALVKSSLIKKSPICVLKLIKESTCEQQVILTSQWSDEHEVHATLQFTDQKTRRVSYDKVDLFLWSIYSWLKDFPKANYQGVGIHFNCFGLDWTMDSKVIPEKKGQKEYDYALTQIQKRFTKIDNAH